LPPHLYASEDEEEEEYDEEEESYREEGRRRRRVRFGNRPLKDAFDEAAEHVDGDENYEDEDYAPVESMFFIYNKDVIKHTNWGSTTFSKIRFNSDI